MRIRIEMVAVLVASAALQTGCVLENGQRDVGEGELEDEIGLDAELSLAAGNVFALNSSVCGVVTIPQLSPSYTFHSRSPSGYCEGTLPLSQQWALYSLNGAYRVQNRLTNLCMQVRGAQLQNGVLVDQDTCTSAAKALWKLEVGTTSKYKRLRNVNSGKCLNIAGGVTGTTMIQYTCGGYANEDFWFRPQ